MTYSYKKDLLTYHSGKVFFKSNNTSVCKSLFKIIEKHGYHIFYKGINFSPIMSVNSNSDLLFELAIIIIIKSST